MSKGRLPNHRQQTFHTWETIILDYLNKTRFQNLAYHGKFKIIHLNAEEFRIYSIFLSEEFGVTAVIRWNWNQ